MGARGIGARPKGGRSGGVKRIPPEAPRPWDDPDLSRAEKVISFLEELPITKGVLAGQKMKLLPEQIAFIREVYVDDASVRIGIKSEPRGNGKSGLCAGLILCHTVGPEAEPRNEIYAAAVDKTQSSKMFQEVAAIIVATPWMDDICNIQKTLKRIEVLSGPGAGSVFEAMSADGRKGHGVATGLFVYDELAAVGDMELLDNLETSLGKRKKSLGLIISTQPPNDQHRLGVMIDDALSGADPSIVCHLLAAPPEADAFSIETIRSVNPALGIYLSEADVLADMRKAKRIPAFEPIYRNRRLNQRVETNLETRIVPIAVWKQNAGKVDRAALRGRMCWGGLDLSGKHDLTALTLVFPSDDDEPVYDVLPIIWTPEGALEHRSAKEQAQFRQWIDGGHLNLIPGAVIRSGWVATELGRLAEEFQIQGIAYDRWRIDDLLADLSDADVKLHLEPRGQGFRDAGPDVSVLIEMAMSARLRHDSPVLTAAMSNAITISDSAGNMKIAKETANRKGPCRVDPAVALAMALGLAQRLPAKKPSVYASRGVLSLSTH